MNESSIKKELEAFSDEHLCKIVAEERDAYDQLYLKVAEGILVERGYEIEYENPNEKADVNHLELSDGQVIFSRSIEDERDVSDRINNLVEEIEFEEQTADHFFEQKYQTQNDHDFLEEYLNVVDSIYRNQTFGGKTQVNSLKNYERLLNTLQERKLEIPETYQEKHAFVMNLMNGQLAKNYRREGNIKLVTGLFLILIPIGLLLAGLLRISLILILGFGIIRIAKGVSLLEKAKDHSRHLNSH